ncbi:leucine-rich repeat-containing protein 4 isoform X1 [Lingula anatina]|uniref:Leucine-rich repeat-containing protein 4 isoform X1 n=2 Tax=Lingula anatina TaxID=7574 RepID=A0A1S3I9I8_LINAN|nr:leucine-rich repeat-containing protein 4 isoform X1 [Lingula anatina]|eukprot:XP_013394858.1 leucine-rich repeat-containing protein 4 isoform X1 [Lingula anatina]
MILKLFMMLWMFVMLLWSATVSGQDCPASAPCTCHQPSSHDQWSLIDCSHQWLGPEVPSFQQSQYDIEALDLSNNFILQIQSHAFWNVRRVRRLLLQHNEISQVAQDSLSNLESLTLLDVSNNHLTSIPSLNDMSQSQWTLNLSYNLLTEVSIGAFLSSNQLKNLDLSFNRITALPSHVFDGLQFTLEVLNISGNKLQAIPIEALQQMYRLRHLSVGQNKIHSLDGATVGIPFTGLLSFDVSSNKLASLPEGAFNNWAHITTLNLKNNSITSLPINIFAHAVSLEAIYLSHNNITGLEGGMFQNLSKLQYLDLRVNPIQCDCQLVWTWTTGHIVDIGQCESSQRKIPLQDFAQKCTTFSQASANMTEKNPQHTKTTVVFTRTIQSQTLGKNGEQIQTSTTKIPSTARGFKTKNTLVTNTASSVIAYSTEGIHSATDFINTRHTTQMPPALPSSRVSPWDNVITIVLPIIAALVTIALIVFGLIIYRRKRNMKKNFHAVRYQVGRETCAGCGQGGIFMPDSQPLTSNNNGCHVANGFHEVT